MSLYTRSTIPRMPWSLASSILRWHQAKVSNGILEGTNSSDPGRQTQGPGLPEQGQDDHHHLPDRRQASPTLYPHDLARSLFFYAHIKFGERYYDPTIGGWTQRDPSGMDANSYAYAVCQSLNFVDPGGLRHTSVECRFMTGVGAVATVVSLAAMFMAPPVGLGGAVVSGWAFLASYTVSGGGTLRPFS